MDYKSLIEAALCAREFAYSPYSAYCVGAALLTESGRVYSGCNVESASYGATICAERTAVVKAVSEGERRFAAIAIVGGRREEAAPLRDFAFPCGICRQLLYEFSPDMTVIVARSTDDYRQYTLTELLPNGFGQGNL